MKEVQEQVELKAKTARSEATVEAYRSQQTFLQQLFPNVSVEGCDGKYEEWLEQFEVKAQDVMEAREEEVNINALFVL